MSLYASGVQIPADLAGAISGVGSPGYNAYNQIGSNYATAKQRLGQGASVAGMNGPMATGPNSYAGNRLATTQGLDIGNLQSTLDTGLGNTGYQNTLQQRDFGQQAQLANEIAKLNNPDLLQQILGGVGQAGRTAAQSYGALGRNAGSGGGGWGYNSNGPLSLYNPNASGYGRYSQ